MTCTYLHFSPRSEEGQFIWSVFKNEAWRVKVAGMGSITGIDLEVARRKCRIAGIEAEIADDLLAACEKGAVSAWNEKEGGEDGDRQD